MPKKYPWQRWPDKKKDKTKSKFHGQNKPSSWKESSIQQIKNKTKTRFTKNYVRVRVNDPSKYSEFRTHDVGREGHTKRIAGYNSETGEWKTQAWLFDKDDLKHDKETQQLYKKVTSGKQ